MFLRPGCNATPSTSTCRSSPSIQMRLYCTGTKNSAMVSRGTSNTIVHSRLSRSNRKPISRPPLKGTVARMWLKCAGTGRTPNTEKSRRQRHNTCHILAHDCKRTATPSVVIRPSAKAFAAYSPTFPKSCQRTVDHGGIPKLHTIERILAVSHLA